MGRGSGSVDDDDPTDLGDVLPEVPFDAEVEGHVARGAADAGTVEPDVNSTVGFGFDEFDVTAVRLDGGTDGLDDFADAVCGVLRGRGDVVRDL